MLSKVDGTGNNSLIIGRKFGKFGSGTCEFIKVSANGASISGDTHMRIAVNTGANEQISQTGVGTGNLL